MSDIKTKSAILHIISQNCKTSTFEIAQQLAVPEKEISDSIAELEKDGVILGYHAIINESSIETSEVKAIIEVRIRPERDGGFDRIAKRLSKFSQVTSLYLMSGGYDLMVEVRGTSLNEIAAFVSEKLAAINGILSTSTHFLLKKYKDSGVLFQEEEKNERLKVVP